MQERNMRRLHSGLALFLISCGNPNTTVTKFNLPPTVSIEAPTAESFFDERTEVVFEALVSDNAQDPEELLMVWSSDLQGDLIGNSLVEADGRVVYPTTSLIPGTHTITLTVTDAEEESSIDTVVVNINDLPESSYLELLSPQMGDVGRSDEPFHFELAVQDDFDDVFVMDISFLTDHQDFAEEDPIGAFCTPIPTEENTAYCTAQLPIGEHILTFAVVNSSDLEAEVTHEFSVRHPDDIDDDGDGFTENEGDCDDVNPEVNPGEPEIPNDLDENCNDIIDEGTENYDDDGDGFTELEGDCNDADSMIYPDSVEFPNGIDDDCDEVIDDETPIYDDDGDGFCESPPCLNAQSSEIDCDDQNSGIFPGAPESEDGLDEDCDGTIDEGTNAYDDDGDGFSENEGDCDDTTTQRSPAVAEICGDGVDNDCDQDQNDEGAQGCVDYYYDYDGDGYGYGDLSLGTSLGVCTCEPTGQFTALQAGDCEDSLPQVSPDQSGFFSAAYSLTSGGSSFDYDCSGSEERENTNVGDCGFGINDGICAMQSPGWSGSVPDCGQSGGLIDDHGDCEWEWAWFNSGCENDPGTSAVQTCR
ncbi:MAG: hypothetical protein CMK59_13795 [Proteobacteria bacterium]|nr:hypothetical protein [Pseudomonadota bacterium]